MAPFELSVVIVFLISVAYCAVDVTFLTGKSRENYQILYKQACLSLNPLSDPGGWTVSAESVGNLW